MFYGHILGCCALGMHKSYFIVDIDFVEGGAKEVAKQDIFSF